MGPFESLYLVRSAKGLKPLINVATMRRAYGWADYLVGGRLAFALVCLALIVAGEV